MKLIWEIQTNVLVIFVPSKAVSNPRYVFTKLLFLFNPSLVAEPKKISDQLFFSIAHFHFKIASASCCLNVKLIITRVQGFWTHLWKMRGYFSCCFHIILYAFIHLWHVFVQCYYFSYAWIIAHHFCFASVCHIKCGKMKYAAVTPWKEYFDSKEAQAIHCLRNKNVFYLKIAN